MSHSRLRQRPRMQPSNGYFPPGQGGFPTPGGFPLPEADFPPFPPSKALPPKVGPQLGPVDPKWLCWEDYGAAAMLPYFCKGVAATVGTVDPVSQCAAGIRSVVDAWCMYDPPRQTPMGPGDACGPGTETILDGVGMAEMIALQLYEKDIVYLAKKSLSAYMAKKQTTCGVAMM